MIIHQREDIRGHYSMWEYMTLNTSAAINISLVDLDALGSEGWELVAVVFNPILREIIYTFKRQL